MFFVFKQKTAYEMRISDWSSDVCSSDLITVQADRDGDERTRQALLGGTVRNARQHKRYVAADGSLIPVQVDVSLARDALGAPQYFITQELGRASGRERVGQYV